MALVSKQELVLPLIGFVFFAELGVELRCRRSGTAARAASASSRWRRSTTACSVKGGIFQPGASPWHEVQIVVRAWIVAARVRDGEPGPAEGALMARFQADGGAAAGRRSSRASSSSRCSSASTRSRARVEVARPDAAGGAPLLDRARADRASASSCRRATPRRRARRRSSGASCGARSLFRVAALVRAARRLPHRARAVCARCIPALRRLRRSCARARLRARRSAARRTARTAGSTLPLVGLTFQPSELARIVMVLWVADRCIRLGPASRDLRRGVLPMLALGLVVLRR